MGSGLGLSHKDGAVNMNVYKIKLDLNYRMIFHANASNPEVRPFIYWSAETSSAEYEKWVPRRFTDGDPNDESYEGWKPLGDFLSAHGSIALRPAAMEKFGRLLSKYGVLLPLLYNDMQLHWFHCTTTIDALDPAKMIGTYFRERWGDVQRFAFQADRLKDAMVFGCPPSFVGSFVFATDTFKQIVESSGLKGLDFWLVWSDEPEGMEKLMAWEKKVGYKLPPM
jgi:hypothetical protein